MGKLAIWWDSYFDLMIKAPSILSDVVTAYLLYRIAAKYLSFEKSMLLLAFYVFNPAVLIYSTSWGQVDSFFTMIVVGAVFLLVERKLYLSTILFTLCCIDETTRDHLFTSVILCTGSIQIDKRDIVKSCHSIRYSYSSKPSFLLWAKLELDQTVFVPSAITHMLQ